MLLFLFYVCESAFVFVFMCVCVSFWVIQLHFHNFTFFSFSRVCGKIFEIIFFSFFVFVLQRLNQWMGKATGLWQEKVYVAHKNNREFIMSNKLKRKINWVLINLLCFGIVLWIWPSFGALYCLENWKQLKSIYLHMD